jgi:MFS transporter, ACS family, hexuronate transporter
MNRMRPVSYSPWLLFGLLTLAGILNLLDRQIISVLKPTIAQDLGWTDDDYGTLGAVFQGSMAIGLLMAGPLVDKIGVKWANAVGVFTWSLAAMAHGLAHTMTQFMACRIGLGVTEAMGTPSTIKTVATILPANLRSTGFGVINAINSIGAIAAPILIPILAMPFGWRGAFVIGGVAGVIWMVAWLAATRKANFDEVPGGEAVAPAATPPPPVAHEPFTAFLRLRSTWAIAGAKVLSDATWWLMLFWMPDFLNRQFGLTGVAIGPPLALAYTGAAIGALLSGTLATRLLAAGLPVDRVRKGAMLVCGLMVLVLPLAGQTDNYWQAAGILAVVLAAHQGFSTNLFALITDVTDKSQVGRVTSFAAFCGNIGGMTIIKGAGMVLTAGLGYGPLFAFAGLSYLLALGWIQLLLPKIVPLEAGGAPTPSLGH